MTPIELLTLRLNEYKHALDKSINMFRVGTIDEQTHKTHKKNLIPLIQSYEQAIKKLQE